MVLKKVSFGFNGLGKVSASSFSLNPSLTVFPPSIAINLQFYSQTNLSIFDKLYCNLIKDKSNEEQGMDLVRLECVFLFVAV